MAQKPSIPKGTRDFSPAEVAKRSYIMNTIRMQFQQYGFQPIETPSFENSSTLMGKYGEEGDRLIFKILDSGEYFKTVKDGVMNLDSFLQEIVQKVKNNFTTLTNLIEKEELNFSELKHNAEDLLSYLNVELYHENLSYDSLIDYFKKNTFEFAESLIDIYDAYLENKPSKNQNIKILIERIFNETKDTYLDDNKLESYKNFRELKINNITKDISEKALRYDLTVPFARYVVQHQNDIAFPFKRYQMQPVWRADRPQKGRFREFYQCDADVVGSDSLWQEVEFVQLYDAVFTALKLERVTIKMNNRKILSGIAEVIGASDKLIDFTVALDKLDKIGKEKVIEEMMSKGITEDAIGKLDPLFTISGSFGDQLTTLKELLATSEVGMQGIEELLFINEAIESLGLESATLQLDVTLARGLNYYTGAIFEVAAPEGVAMGSIGGGGRYADLTGIFGLKDVSGVGISFGLDRIALVLEELNLFPEEAIEGTKVLFINFGNAEALYAMKAIKQLRTQGITAVLYPDAAKMKKQMTYANRREIPFVILAGDQEVTNNTFTVKDMMAGEQETVSLDTLMERLR